MTLMSTGTLFYRQRLLNFSLRIACCPSRNGEV